ncbi:hypothetical protein VTN96DRAFT_3322 [Rasamsonia emersonii]
MLDRSWSSAVLRAVHPHSQRHASRCWAAGRTRKRRKTVPPGFVTFCSRRAPAALLFLLSSRIQQTNQSPSAPVTHHEATPASARSSDSGQSRQLSVSVSALLSPQAGPESRCARRLRCVRLSSHSRALGKPARFSDPTRPIHSLVLPGTTLCLSPTLTKTACRWLACCALGLGPVNDALIALGRCPFRRRRVSLSACIAWAIGTSPLLLSAVKYAVPRGRGRRAVAV